MYAEATFPPYLNGPFYVLDASVAEKLFNAAHNEPLINMEDVYVTGILTSKCGVQPTHCTRIYSMPFDLADTCAHRNCIMEHLKADKIHNLPQIVANVFNQSIMCSFEN